MKILDDLDYLFIHIDNLEVVVKDTLNDHLVKSEDLDSSNHTGAVIHRHSNVIDSTGIRYTFKYSSINFPFFNFRVNKDTVYHKLSEFHSDQAKELFVLAKNDQFNSDSLSREVNILYSKKGIYKNVDEDLFDRRVLDLELRASELKKNAAQKAKHALFLEQSLGESSNLILAATHDEANMMYEESPKRKVIEKVSPEKKDVQIIKDANVEISKDVSVSELTVASQVIDEDEGGYLDYEYEYCFQVAVFDKRPNNAFYESLGFVKEEIVDGGKSFRYLTGSYRTYAKANSYRTQIKSVFPSAFIVVYKNGIRTDIKEAKDVTDPVASIQGAAAKYDNSDLSGEITYRIQIGVFAGEIPEELNTTMERYKAFGSFYERRFDGKTICSIGRFKSISELADLKKNLQRAGYTDAFTVAYCNKKKVSLQACIKKAKKSTSSVVVEQPAMVVNETQFTTSDLTGDINFRVQIGVFANEVPEETRLLMNKYKVFGAFSEKLSSGKIVCTIGQFDLISDAGILKTKLHKSGCFDAFTVAYNGNKRISIQDAIRLLK